jgi:hypothetical protein
VAALRRQQRAAHFTEADSRCAVALAPAAKGDGVAVFQEGAGLAIGQRELPLSTLRQFQQRSGLLFAGA